MCVGCLQSCTLFATTKKSIMQTSLLFYSIDDEQAASSVAEVRVAFGRDRKKIFLISAGVLAAAGCMLLKYPNCELLY